MAGGWNQMTLKVHFTLSHSLILWLELLVLRFQLGLELLGLGLGSGFGFGLVGLGLGLVSSTGSMCQLCNV